MPRVPFAVHSYKLDSLPASAQDLINLYAEELPEGSRSPVMVRHVPGFELFATGGSSKVWAMCEFQGEMYFVTGFSTLVLYKTTSAGVVTSIGTLTGGGSPVSMAASASQLVVVASPYAWVVSGGVATKITDADFPSVQNVTYLGGYFVYTKTSSDQYVVSDLNDASSYSALMIASAEGVPDQVRRVIARNNELWVFGSRSIEIHVQTGEANFPFQRANGGTVDIGTPAAASVANVADSICWLGSDRIVYRATGYQPQRISTHAIEKEIEPFVQPELATGFAINFQGHPQYVLSFPSTTQVNTGPGRTFVYDIATGLWHRRASTITSGVPGGWGVACAARFGASTLAAKMLVGGASGGNLYTLKQSLATEAGTSLTAIATLPPLWARGEIARLDSVELEMETGVNASTLDVALSWSDDGGQTWATGVERSMGASGDYGIRVIWRRLGSFRNRILRFTFDAGAKIAAYGADVRISGTNIQMGDQPRAPA